MSKANAFHAPWATDEALPTTVRDCNGEMIADFYMPIFTDDGEDLPEGCLEKARLGAAAPELRDALKAALTAANELGLSSSVFPRQQIEAVLAKAEGRHDD